MDNNFLIWTLFFPRITLIYYYANNWIPANAIPFFGDVVMTVIIPRLLVLFYIYQNIGANNFWFWAHLVMLIICLSSSISGVETRKSEASA